MVVLADNQRVWSYLEPLFMKSKEVQEELPEDAARFKGMNFFFWTDSYQHLRSLWFRRREKSLFVYLHYSASFLLLEICFGSLFQLIDFWLYYVYTVYCAVLFI